MSNFRALLGGDRPRPPRPDNLGSRHDMKNRESGSPYPNELRKRAEKALREALERTTPAGATEPDQPSLSHELTVHQIELEMQNEEQQRANAEMAKFNVIV